MNRIETGEQSEEKSEVNGEEMFDELTAIRNIQSAAVRVEAWESFIDKYERQNLNEMSQEIMWRAEAYLKIDRASSQISQLAA
jgi:hypothetical protein